MRKPFVLLILICLSLVMNVYAQEDANCPGAPQPRLTVGGQGRVLPGDANNLRDQPARAGNRIGAIPGGEAFMVLEGPVCADGFNWWRVDYGGLNGWTVEGLGADYFVEPYDPDTPDATPPAQTPAAAPTTTPQPAPTPEYPLSVENALAVGKRARVYLPEGDLLRVRAEPGTGAAVVARVQDGEVVRVLDGPREADSFRWWQVETSGGTQGWMIEAAESLDYRDEPRLLPVLIPACPYTSERIVFVLYPYIYSASHDGEQRCILAILDGPRLHTTWGSLMYIPNQPFMSPDGTQLAFVSLVPAPNASGTFYDLFSVSMDGLALRRLTSGSDVYWMDWSPDGQRIALARNVNNQAATQIWVIDADGQRPVRLSEGRQNKPWVGWMPDSKTLLYIEEYPQGRVSPQIFSPRDYALRSIGADGSAPRELWRLTGNIEVRYLALSPDGAHLAAVIVTADDLGEPTQVETLLFEVPTGEQRLLYANWWSSAWSPDGARFAAFSADFVALYPAAGGDPMVIETGDIYPDYAGGTWSPDGKTLYISTDAGFLRVAVERGTVEEFPILSAYDYSIGEGLRNIVVQP